MKSDKVIKPLTVDADNPHLTLQGVSMIVALDEFMRQGRIAEKFRVPLQKRANAIGKMLVTGDTVAYNEKSKQYEIVKEAD
jgi:hypothetical protein